MLHDVALQSDNQQATDRSIWEQHGIGTAMLPECDHHLFQIGLNELLQAWQEVKRASTFILQELEHYGKMRLEFTRNGRGYKHDCSDMAQAVDLWKTFRYLCSGLCGITSGDRG